MKLSDAHALVLSGVFLAIFCHFPADIILWRNKGCHNDGCLWLALPELFSYFSLFLNAVIAASFTGFGLYASIKSGPRVALPIALGLIPIIAALVGQMKFVGLLS